MLQFVRTITNMYLRELLEEGDLEKIREHICETFSKKKRQVKHGDFYKTILVLFDTYPELAKETIDSLESCGTPRDYIILLERSENIQLNNYLYTYIAKVIRQDAIKLQTKSKEQISTMAKWMPRENSNKDRKIGFVDKIVKLMYIDSETSIAKKKLRVLRKLLNEELGSIEHYMSTKQYEKIDFNKMPNLSLKRHLSKLKNIEEPTRSNFRKHLLERYSRFSLSQYIWKIINKIDEVEKDILIEVWEARKFYYAQKLRQFFCPTTHNKYQSITIVLQLAESTNREYISSTIIGLALLLADPEIANIYIGKTRPNIFTNARKPRLVQLDGNNIINSANKLLRYYTTKETIDLLTIKEIPRTEDSGTPKQYNDSQNHIIVLTNKKYDATPGINTSENDVTDITWICLDRRSDFYRRTTCNNITCWEPDIPITTTDITIPTEIQELIPEIIGDGADSGATDNKVIAKDRNKKLRAVEIWQRNNQSYVEQVEGALGDFADSNILFGPCDYDDQALNFMIMLALIVEMRGGNIFIWTRKRIYRSKMDRLARISDVMTRIKKDLVKHVDTYLHLPGVELGPGSDQELIQGKRLIIMSSTSYMPCDRLESGSFWNGKPMWIVLGEGVCGGYQRNEYEDSIVWMAI